jgi:hypothetical protein
MSTDWIAYRLGMLCCDKTGRFRSGAALVDYAARVALLTDLALKGRVSSTGPGTEIDTAPTGFTPADTLLRYVDGHPSDTMADLFMRAPVTMLDILEPERTGGRRRRQRWVRLNPDLIEAERVRLKRPYTDDSEPEATAALILIAESLLLTTTLGPDRPVPDQCGRAGWLIADCLAFLTHTREKFALISTVAMGSG